MLYQDLIQRPLSELGYTLKGDLPSSNAILVRAVDKSNSPVAIKIGNLAHDNDFTLDFFYRNRLSGAVGICEIVEQGRLNVRDNAIMCYFTMTKYEHNLRTLITEKHYDSLDKILELGIQLAQTLIGIHSEKVIHRDLKPSNILMDGETPLLADFGSASHYTLNAKKSGTRLYQHPDFEGMAIPSIDVYQLGIVLTEALLDVSFETEGHSFFYSSFTNANLEEAAKEKCNSSSIAVDFVILLLGIHKRLGNLCNWVEDPSINPDASKPMTDILHDLKFLQDSLHNFEESIILS